MQVRLIVFDEPQIIASRFHNLHAHRPVGLQRIAGDHHAAEIKGGEHLRYHSYFIGVVVHRQSCQHHTGCWQVSGHQMHALRLP